MFSVRVAVNLGLGGRSTNASKEAQVMDLNLVCAFAP